MSEFQNEVVVTGGPFNVTLLEGDFCVIQIPTARVPSVAWWILREYVYDIENTFKKKYSTTFSSILLDDDGLSVVCSPNELSVLKSLSTELNISPKKWRALNVDVVGSATEFPGAVYFLANTLSEINISILHISTFESEILLVQEQDIEAACKLLQSLPTKIPSFLRRNAGSGSSLVQEVDEAALAETYKPLEAAAEVEDKKELIDLESVSVGKFKEGFVLSVLPSSVMLARLSEDFKLSDCGDILAKLLLFDERYSFLERDIAKRTSPISEGSGSGTKFMFGIWRCDNEITLLLEESDMDRFPEGALVVSPQPWWIIKLSGRAIGYDETGIVSAMSQVESDVPTLNISTAITNCTLVPHERLEYTLELLSKALQCPVKY